MRCVPQREQELRTVTEALAGPQDAYSVASVLWTRFGLDALQVGIQVGEEQAGSG